MIGPEYKISEAERTHLVGLGTQPGFQVLVNICESEVSKFTVDLLNVSTADPQDIVAKHNLAKAAAMFWARVYSRINSEQQIYLGQNQAKEVQPDSTEGTFS